MRTVGHTVGAKVYYLTIKMMYLRPPFVAAIKMMYLRPLFVAAMAILANGQALRRHRRRNANIHNVDTWFFPHEEEDRLLAEEMANFGRERMLNGGMSMSDVNVDAIGRSAIRYIWRFPFECTHDSGWYWGSVEPRYNTVL
jgi:hypothetical protein